MAANLAKMPNPFMGIPDIHQHIANVDGYTRKAKRSSTKRKAPAKRSKRSS